MKRTSPAIRDLAPDERPRERLLSHGPQTLSDCELVAVLLRTGRPGASALELGRQLLAEGGGLGGLTRLGHGELRREGLGEAKVASLMAAVELARRLARSQLPERRPMSRPNQVAGYLRLRYGHLAQEVMGAFFLDVRNRLLAERELFRGVANRVLVDPRTIYREALVRDASGLLIFHTHPSGDPSPSAEDLLFTQRMASAGALLGVALVDHLVVGLSSGYWVSLLERGGWREG